MSVSVADVDVGGLSGRGTGNDGVGVVDARREKGSSAKRGGGKAELTAALNRSAFVSSWSGSLSRSEVVLSRLVSSYAGNGSPIER